jgi:hypothetical protein
MYCKCDILRKVKTKRNSKGEYGYTKEHMDKSSVGIEFETKMQTVESCEGSKERR